jgi:hypothetical protein
VDLWNLAVLLAGGSVSGVLAGILGIGGGVLLNPLLVALGYAPVQAAATSSLAILLTSTAGTLQNWRMGFLQLNKIVFLGIPAILTSQIGVLLATAAPSYLLAAGFGCLLLANVYLVGLKKSAMSQAVTLEQPGAEPDTWPLSRFLPQLFTGGGAGILAGLFGVGGGVIMVPMQILLLGEGIKSAVRTSLGVIVITAISASGGHALQGNVLYLPGLCLGVGGLLGVQLGTRFLPRLADPVVTLLFRLLMGSMSVYMFWTAWGLSFSG